MRIFLIGFMGSGKSSLGAAIAEDLELRFIDLDKSVETLAGKDMPTIFKTDGETHFRELEAKALRQQLKEEDFVMACGGGTPIYSDNMDAMNEAGVTIYLKLSTDTLTERLAAETESRPLLNDLKGHELWTFVHENLTEREPFYLKAKYKVKAKDLKAAELVEFIRLYELQDEEVVESKSDEEEE